MSAAAAPGYSRPCGVRFDACGLSVCACAPIPAPTVNDPHGAVEAPTPATEGARP